MIFLKKAWTSPSGQFGSFRDLFLKPFSLRFFSARFASLYQIETLNFVSILKKKIRFVRFASQNCSLCFTKLRLSIFSQFWKTISLCSLRFALSFASLRFALWAKKNFRFASLSQFSFGRNLYACDKVFRRDRRFFAFFNSRGENSIKKFRNCWVTCQ